jgi:gliding motility-associated-like protein
VNYTSTGTKTITLNLSGGGCAPSSSTQTVVVTDAPTSTFTATSTVCGSEAALITYTGNAPANATYTWNFDGGTAIPVNGQGPFSVTWATPGVKTIRLIVSIGTCASVETTAQVTVTQAPTATFTVPPGGVCVNNPIVVTYTGNAPANATYTWGLDGGTAVPANGQGPLSVTWNTSGNKSLTLQVAIGNCVSAITTVPVVVHAIPQSTFTVTAGVCPGQNATTSYTGTTGAGTVYNWNFAGATVASGTGAGPYNLNWAAEGTYNLTLQVTSAQGCISATTTQPVGVNPIPVASFTATPASLCVGEETTLQYNGAPNASLSYLWAFDTGAATPGGTASGTQEVSWPAAGTRTIGLRVVALGCTSAVVTNQIVINPTPTATFTTSAAVCTGSTINVNYTGSGSAAAVYTWNFAGGTTTGNTNPSPFTIGWNTSGTKPLSLVVTEFGCASQPFVQNVVVNQTPTSTFTAGSNVCAGSANNITYTGNAGSSATYAWAFPSGTPAAPAGQGPHAVTWTNPGNYNLTLTVTENNCVSSLTTQAITVNAIPTASFNAASPICLNATSAITFTGIAANNAAYNWQFDGGTPNSTTNPGPFGLSWTTAGSKNLSLTVSQNGCTSQPFSQTVIVNPVPTSLFSASSPVCIGNPSAVNYIGSASAGASYAWSFTGGNPANTVGQGPHNVTYNTAGTYFLNLTVTENGCVSPITQLQVIVNPIPTADFTVTSPICLDGIATIVYSGTASTNSLFNWNFGGGITPTQVGPGPFEVKWLTPGNKTISLDVNALGCQSPAFTQTIEVLPLPNVDAGLDQQSCSGASVNLGTPALPGLTYFWSPGVGLTDVNSAITSASRTNNLAQAADYEYILRADDGQCIAFDTVVYRVTAPPFVSFAAPQGQCLGGNTFNFQAEGSFSTNSNFIWNFGGNANIPSSSIANPQNIVFGSIGSQTITLQVADGGCFSNLYSADVLVYPDPIVDFVAELNRGCAELKVAFNNLSQSPGTVFYTWYFGDGGTSNSPEPSYTYTKAGLYDVSLKATTANGCTATMDRKEYVEVYPVPVPYFSMNASELDMIAPDLQISGGVMNTDSVWYYLNGDTLLGPNHFVTFEDTGYYEILQVVENEYGCTDSLNRFIKVNPGYRIYIPNSFSPNNDGTNDFFTIYGEEISDFEVVIFNRWGQQIYRSFDLENGWDGTTGLSDNKVSQGVYLYIVKATDDLGFVHKFKGTVNVVQ